MWAADNAVTNCNVFTDPDSIPALKDIARFLVFMAVVMATAGGAFRYFSQEPVTAIDTDISSQSRIDRAK